ncbi:hypothetical protein [Microcella sp.]|uniref:hypothetical protein n=1 Tax=Microcella sp. TaxID=1913979 RepID=UPI002566F907|nr:hypothetical protein [Microcella sp.]MBX9472555.1 hypothetical protein [Microcella sp.]
MHDDEKDARRLAATRLALISATLVYAAVAMTVVFAGPDVVVGHFGASGQPTRRDATGPFVLSLSLVLLGLLALFVSMPTLIRRIPIEFVNVPNRERWNTPARRRVLARRLAADLNLIGVATVLLLTSALVLSALGGIDVDLPGWIFLLMLAAYLWCVGVLLVQMMVGKRYQPPADA